MKKLPCVSLLKINANKSRAIKGKSYTQHKDEKYKIYYKIRFETRFYLVALEY